MNTQITILTQSRHFILEKIKDLSIEQLNKTPEKFNNNIAWNVAHLVVTQQLLCYKLANVSMLISEDFANLYRKGTKPEALITKEEWEHIIKLFVSLPKQFEKDVTSGLFNSYNNYSTSMGVTLKNINDACNYNTHHEGIHFGTILQLIKLV